MKTSGSVATVENRPSHRWSRFAECGPSPVRVLHRGGLKIYNDDPWQGIWQRYLKYGADSCMTAVVRPMAGPVLGMRNSLAASEGRPAGKRVERAAIGGLWGLGKGAVGCGVSLGVGAYALVKGSALGVATGAYALEQKFGSAAHKVDRRVTATPASLPASV